MYSLIMLMDSYPENHDSNTDMDCQSGLIILNGLKPGQYRFI